ncbi:MAG TPA: hypothetical protein VEX15_23280 [Nocardioidaceae bacterium]|nr:hypothetical protein [Nocardioidaceae bacterium]
MAIKRLVGLVSVALVITVAPAVPTNAQPSAPRSTDRLDPDGTDRGAWPLRDGDELTWRSPAPLPIGDARPEFRLGHRLLGYPQIESDRRTLTLSDVDLTDRQAERVEVWLGTDRLDAAGRVDLPRSNTAPVPVGPTTTPADDPGEHGDHPFVGFDYRSDPLPWPAYEGPMEVLGHAVLPEDVDNAPLVLFLHGRHVACYGRGDNGSWPCHGQSKPVPSQLGYDYLQRMLASQGYATVSIAANAINQQDWVSPDGGASARSALVRHHLKLLSQWAVDPDRPRWFGEIDLDRVVLVGHSRGGEGVDQAVIDTTAAAPYRIEGQVLIGPVDFAYQTAGYMPTVVLLPYCDGDVYDLQGQRYVDAAGTLTADDPTLRSSVLMRGANHNFFNTEWTPGISQAPSNDDWYDQQHPLCGRKASPTRLSAAEQRRAARTFIGAAVQGFDADDRAALDVLDADRPVELPAAGGAVAWTHALGGDRDTVRVGAGAHVTGAARACRSGTTSPFGRQALPLCGPGAYDRELHWTLAYSWWLSPATPYRRLGLTRQLQLEWSRPDTVGGLSLDEPLDLSPSGSTLDLRVVSDPAQGPTRIAVRLSDSDSSWTAPDTLLRRLPGSNNLVALWARTVRVGLDDAAADLDLTDIRSIDLIGRSDTGRVWLLDASARRPDLSPAPDAMLPSIRIGKVSVQEGDDGDEAVAEVPYTVVGDVAAPARFGVAMTQSSFEGRTPNRYEVVTVSPGDTEGVIEVPYEADRRDDRAQTGETVMGVPLTGLAMGDYFGRVIINDDDPRPRLSFGVERKRVGYGDDLVFVTRLAAPVDYRLSVSLTGVVLDRFRPLRVADVPEKWARRHLGEDAPARSAVAKRLSRVFASIKAGELKTRFVVPTRAHPPHPNPKALTLRLTSPMLDQPLRATVRVR